MHVGSFGFASSSISTMNLRLSVSRLGWFDLVRISANDEYERVKVVFSCVYSTLALMSPYGDFPISYFVVLIFADNWKFEG